MKKIKVYLDMDGTIANLYTIDQWLEKLQNENPTVFLECAQLVTQEQLLKVFPQEQFEIVILSMTPKNCTNEYHKQVIDQKNQWLNVNFPLLTKRIFLKYGHNKNLKNSANAILVDDSKPIRDNFRGIALNPTTLW